ncbi:MAG: ferritin [Bacteroidota bacterium]|nr:ferritin [Bacteroidota bacterium]
MLNKKVEDALNKQIVIEAFSSQLYLAMASWCEIKGYAGSADFLYKQTEEERIHMLKLFKYINDRAGHAIVPELYKPPQDFTSIVELFEEVLKHEQMVSDSINKQLEVAMTEKDYTTANFLQWYVNEQIEEEATARHILDIIKLIGKDNPGGYYLIDKELEKIAAAKTVTTLNAVTTNPPAA